MIVWIVGCLALLVAWRRDRHWRSVAATKEAALEHFVSENTRLRDDRRRLMGAMSGGYSSGEWSGFPSDECLEWYVDAIRAATLALSGPDKVDQGARERIVADLWMIDRYFERVAEELNRAELRSSSPIKLERNDDLFKRAIGNDAASPYPGLPPGSQPECAEL